MDRTRPIPRDVVIVPCYERPEYTRVCLEYLSRARGIEGKEVWLCQDQHTYDSFGSTTKEMYPNVKFGNQIFPGRFLYAVKTDSLGYDGESYGNSENIILSLHAAYTHGAERIFIVEDDIMVAPDIFEWHERMLREVDPLVSCASALNKSAHFQINGPDRMDETIKDRNAFKRVHTAYSSHAAAFTRTNLKDILVRVDQALEWGKWCPGKEQDLLIQHLMGLLTFPNRGSVWPYVPRAFNVGMYSYHINTAMKFNGTFEEKCAALRATIKDPAKLREMSCNNQTITAVPDFEGDECPRR